MTVNPVYVFALIFLMVLLVSSGLSMWYSDLKADVHIFIKKPLLEIGSWKIFLDNGFSCKGFDDASLTVDKRRLAVEIYGNASFMWVGIVVENNDVLPAVVKGVKVWIDEGTDVVVPSLQVYLYLPIKTGVGNQPYWGSVNCSDLPIQGYLGGGNITLDPGYKLVIWIMVSLFTSTGGYTVYLSIDE